MKFISATLFFLLVAASPAFSQWRQNDKRAGNAPDRKEVSGFGGHLIVVENPRDFIQEWLRPETPKIKSATVVKRGESIGAFVLFAGCKTDTQGMCNSEVDYTIYRSDGRIFAERKRQPLWKEQSPPAPIIQLGRAILAFQLGKDDSSGEYKVKAKVSDLNANISFELETKFRLK
ncbi:MAG: hypothetical protein QOJ64_1608 [Acidobacteriota bacterium]|jgi:hypothetical protein|nr:hypothetical protein [Acidobacteriota bacterium]